MPRLIAWDLETTNLNANFGYLLCGGWKVLGSKRAQVIDITQSKSFKKDPTNDKELCKRLYDVLSEADMWITWFGCVTPEQRVLKSDLTWVPAGDLKVGDRLVGVDDKPCPGRRRRRYRLSEVLHHEILIRETVRVHLTDGSHIDVTPDHPFLIPTNKANGANWQWRRADALREGDWLTRVLPVWEPNHSWEAAYLSGLYDGEGSLSQFRSTQGGTLTTVGLTQNEGSVLEEAHRCLEALGFEARVHSHHRARDTKCKALFVAGGLPERLRFLGTVQPRRLLEKLDVDKLGSVFASQEGRTQVVRVEGLGKKGIVGMSTSTETYLSEGFVSHNTYFDVPYLNSRLLRHNLPPLPPVPHLDGWKVARYKLKLNSNRLQSVTSFLGLEDKTPLDGPTWVKAMAGHRKSIKYVVEHCRQDCEVLQQVYERLKPLAQGHPNLNLFQGTTHACPRCGSLDLQCRGKQVTTTQTYQRFQCQSCGGWSRARAADPRGRWEKVEVR